MASLCVAWWHKGAPGREQLVAQLTVYLCARAVRSGDPIKLPPRCALRLGSQSCMTDPASTTIPAYILCGVLG